MMQHQLSIRARFRPEMLERVLRVVRHRGFQVCAMNMVSPANADSINIELTVASPRPVALLSSQLANCWTSPASRSSSQHHNKYAPEAPRRINNNDKESRLHLVQW